MSELQSEHIKSHLQVFVSDQYYIEISKQFTLFTTGVHPSSNIYYVPSLMPFLLLTVDSGAETIHHSNGESKQIDSTETISL